MSRRKLSASAKKLCAAAQGWKCGDCSQLLDAAFQVDHVLALADGGTDAPGNLRALCASCHARKTQVEGLFRTEQRRSVERFNGLFEPFPGGAFPLAVAKRASIQQFGHTFDERHVSVQLAHMAHFSPSMLSLFEAAGMPTEEGGLVLQGVRRRVASTRSVK